jgi:hypothetical protein
MEIPESLKQLRENLEQGLPAEQLKNQVKPMISYYLEKGPSNLRLNFWAVMPAEKQELLVRALFLYLIEIPATEKLLALDLLQILYTDADDELKGVLMAIFYAALLEKRNFQLALAALEFYVHLWKNSEEDEPIRAEIFPKLLDGMESDNETVASEITFETIKLLDDATPRERERFFDHLLVLAETAKDEELQYAYFESLNETLTKYLADLENFPGKTLQTRCLRLLEKHKRIGDPRAAFSLIRLILDQKITFDEDGEKILWGIFKKMLKKITYEYQLSYWELLYTFIQVAAYIPKEKFLKPFLVPLERLFKHRDEIAIEVRPIIEEFVTWLWDQNLLSTKLKDRFYN